MVLSAQGDKIFKEKLVVQWNKRNGNVRGISYPAKLSSCVKEFLKILSCERNHQKEVDANVIEQETQVTTHQVLELGIFGHLVQALVSKIQESGCRTPSKGKTPRPGIWQACTCMEVQRDHCMKLFR